MKLWAMCLKCRFEWWDNGTIDGTCPECHARHITAGTEEPSEAVKAKMMEEEHELQAQKIKAQR